MRSSFRALSKSFSARVKSEAHELFNKNAFEFLAQKNVKFEYDWSVANPIDFPHPVHKSDEAGTLLSLYNYHENPPPNPALIESAKNYFLAQNIPCDEQNIIIGTGVFNILSNLYDALQIKEKEQKILIPIPTFGMFYKQCFDKEITTEFLPTSKEQNWQIDPEMLEKKLRENPEIKILLLNFPNNPTGAVMTEENARAIAKVLNHHSTVLVFSDEILKDTILGDKESFSLAQIPELKDRVVVLNSAEKSRSLAGLRVAFANLPSKIANLYRANCEAIMPPTIHQKVVANSLANSKENQEFLTNAAEKYRQNIAHLKEQISFLNQELGGHFQEQKEYVKPYIENPESGNVFLLDFSGLKGCWAGDGKLLNTGLDVANFLLTKVGLKTVPAEYFFIDAKKMAICIPTSTHQTEVKIVFEKIAEAMKQHLKPPTKFQVNSEIGNSRGAKG